LVLALSGCGGIRNGARFGPSIQPDSAAAPEFSVAPGRYSLPQTVRISPAIPQALVYYTTDGTEPTASSRIYGGPITVNTNITLKAIAIKDDTASKMATAEYFIDPSHESVSDTPVPDVFVRDSGSKDAFQVLKWAGFKSALTYSYDDGFIQQIRDYPKLQATNTRMTFYLICRSEHDPATWAQAVKDGHELGNHTVHHCHSDGTCGPGVTWSGSVAAEYDECTNYLKERYGLEDVWTTASPFGDRGYVPVAKTRFFLNRGTIQGQIGVNGGADPFFLNAYVAKTGDGVFVFKQMIDLAEQHGRWQIFSFHSLDDGYDWVNVDDLIASINHAKSKKDVWIDSVVNVGAYWIGQQAASNGTKTVTRNGVMISWTLPNHFPTGKFVRVTTNLRTLKQNGAMIPRNPAGYYEVALDPGNLTVSR